MGGGIDDGDHKVSHADAAYKCAAGWAGFAVRAQESFNPSSPAHSLSAVWPCRHTCPRCGSKRSFRVAADNYGPGLWWEPAGPRSTSTCSPRRTGTRLLRPLHPRRQLSCRAPDDDDSEGAGLGRPWALTRRPWPNLPGLLITHDPRPSNRYQDAPPGPPPGPRIAKLSPSTAKGPTHVLNVVALLVVGLLFRPRLSARSPIANTRHRFCRVLIQLRANEAEITPIGEMRTPRPDLSMGPALSPAHV